MLPRRVPAQRNRTLPVLDAQLDLPSSISTPSHSANEMSLQEISTAVVQNNQMLQLNSPMVQPSLPSSPTHCMNDVPQEHIHPSEERNSQLPQLDSSLDLLPLTLSSPLPSASSFVRSRVNSLAPVSPPYVLNLHNNLPSASNFLRNRVDSFDMACQQLERAIANENFEEIPVNNEIKQEPPTVDMLNEDVIVILDDDDVVAEIKQEPETVELSEDIEIVVDRMLDRPVAIQDDNNNRNFADAGDDDEIIFEVPDDDAFPMPLQCNGDGLIKMENDTLSGELPFTLKVSSCMPRI